MSFMHSMVFYFCKKGKRRYSPDEPQDYPAKRTAEVRQNRFVRIPKQVRIIETVLGSVPAELLRHPKNPTDRIALYLHGGGFVVGSVKTRRMFTGYIASKLGYNAAAPYYGNFTGCPPICLWASESEALRDDSLILFEKLKQAGHPCKLYLRDGMVHTWLVIPCIPEARRDLKTVKSCLDAAIDGTLCGEPTAIHLEDHHG